MLGLVLTFAVDYLPCGDYPRLCEMVKEVQTISDEIQKLQDFRGLNQDEIEVKLSQIESKLQRLDAIIKEINKMFQEDPSLNAVKCEAKCSGGSCSCWFCSCGCDDNGNPWCGSSPNLNGNNTTDNGDFKVQSFENNLNSGYVGFYGIYDINGRKVYEGRLNGRLPELKKGVYFLKGEDGKVKKIVVR